VEAVLRGFWGGFLNRLLCFGATARVCSRSGTGALRQALDLPAVSIVFVKVFVCLGQVVDFEVAGVPVQRLVGEVDCEVSELRGLR